MKIKASVFAIAAIALLVSCTTTPNHSKPAESRPAFQPTYLTGREALQKMYVASRAWAADSKPYSLRSIATADDNGQNGRAGIWGAGFASATRKSIKFFTWSGIKSDNAPEPGISSRPEDTYNPANPSTAVFELAFLKIDSGASEGTTALSVAEKHGGEKLIQKDKNIPVFYSLNWNPRENKLIWKVNFGADQNQPKLSVDVDATTGAFIRVEK